MDHHDEPQDNVNDAHPNTPSHDRQNEQRQPDIRTETFIFSGNGGAAFLATVQNIFTRIVGGQIQPQRPFQTQPQPSAVQQSGPSTAEDTAMPSDDMPPLVPVTDLPSSTTTSGPSSSSSLPANTPADHSTPSPNANPPPPPGRRPTRRLPRPHAHIHTPNGDFFAFNLADFPAPQAPPGAAASFTFNVGADVFAGFENFFLHPKEPEPDFDRAKTLLRGMEVVPEGLVKRLERAGGVPGAQGEEEHAGCAVCYGRLLEDVEPGEWDNAQQKEAKEKAKDEDAMKTDEDEFHGRIVALPCAHVYHAECLLPWFARNTTCPTCRFDVDPDSLTWKPHRPPRPEPAVEPNGDFNTEDDPHGEMAEPFGLATVMDAARFNTFFDSLMRMPGHQAMMVNGQPQPEAHSAPSSPRPSGPEHSELRPQEPSIYGPAPPPPPQPPVHAIPAVFRMPMPLFIFPNSQAGLRQRQQQQNAQLPPRPQQEAPSPQASSSVPPPQVQPQHPHWHPRPPVQPEHPQWHPHPEHPHWHPHPQHHPWHPHPPAHPQHPHLHPSPPEAFMPIPFPFPVPIPVPEHVAFHPAVNVPGGPFQTRPRPSRPSRKWVVPDPVGKTLRQRVESKERELGLRCDDPVCGLAPEDDDVGESHHEDMKRVKLRAAYNAQSKACEHRFHPECLVRSTRISATRDSRPILEGADEDVLVQCSVCRAEGWLWKEEWAEGSRT